jgi:hypothetical protein
MANPQPTDAHLRIAHSIEEEIMMRDFTKRQRSILDLILRLSWGCGKKTAIIPMQKDFEVVGIGQGKIKTELDWLINARVISRDQAGKEFAFNKNYDEWKVSIVSGYNKNRLTELLKLNLQTYQNGKLLTETGSNENNRLTETGIIDLPKREELVPDDSVISGIAGSPKESIKESIYIDNINNARAHEDIFEFNGNINLSESEMQTLSEKCSAIKLNHYRCILSKKKSEGYKPPGSDYDELLKIANEGG